MGCLNPEFGLKFITVPWLCGARCVACVWHVFVDCGGCMCELFCGHFLCHN